MNRMPIALLSDVHANRHALDAVLADMTARGLNARYHLGDLVGYSAFPNEVVARLAALPTEDRSDDFLRKMAASA